MATQATETAAATPVAAPTAATTTPSPAAPVDAVAAEAPTKKRRVERRERLRKSALCKHFDKPGGCPFPHCKFAHGRSEIADAGPYSVAAQRTLIREQAVHRAEDKFQKDDGTAATPKRRGTMIERYYTELFSCDTMGNPQEDQYVHMHSNRLCVVGMAASHLALQDELESVQFTQAILESRVAGKKKKGGLFLLPNTVLCHVKCKSGREFALRSCIRGSLIEVNERLQTQPELLKHKHQSDGYLVIVQPKKMEVAEIQQSLLSKEEFTQFRAIPRAVHDATVAAAESAAKAKAKAEGATTDADAGSGNPIEAVATPVGEATSSSKPVTEPATESTAGTAESEPMVQ